MLPISWHHWVALGIHRITCMLPISWHHCVVLGIHRIMLPISWHHCVALGIHRIMLPISWHHCVALPRVRRRAGEDGIVDAALALCSVLAAARGLRGSAPRHDDNTHPARCAFGPSLTAGFCLSRLASPLALGRGADFHALWARFGNPARPLCIPRMHTCAPVLCILKFTQPHACLCILLVPS